MKETIIYTSYTCPYCYKAKSLLNKLGVKYKEIPVDLRPKLREKMAEMAGKTSVPQIWIDNKHVGGFDDLYALEQNGELEKLIL